MRLQSTGPSSVIVLDEEENLRIRKLLLPPLHGERLQQWADFVTQKTLDDIATWPDGQPFSLRPVAERITMSVISKIVFGVRDPVRAEELRLLLPVLFDIPVLAAPGYVTMLVAGHETTATAIAWALERLLRTPRVMDKLLASLDADDTTYLDAVIKETMRIRPVVAQIGRVLTEETVIDGWTVPARTMVVLPMTVIHTDPEIYRDPKEFRPERFLDGNDPGGYAWLPFGGGLRRCPGASLALLEMRAVLTTILRNVRLAPDRPEPERPRVRGITIVPSRGGRVVVTKRLTSPRPAEIEAVAS